MTKVHVRYWVPEKNVLGTELWLWCPTDDDFKAMFKRLATMTPYGPDTILEVDGDCVPERYRWALYQIRRINGGGHNEHVFLEARDRCHDVNHGSRKIHEDMVWFPGSLSPRARRRIARALARSFPLRYGDELSLR